MQHKSTAHHALPKSATNMLINFIGLISAIMAFCVIESDADRLQLSNLQIALLCIAGYAIPIVVLEWLFLKNYQNQSCGIDFSRPAKPDIPRTASKYLGFIFTLALIMGAYLLFDEYRRDFYAPYYQLLYATLPILALIAMPYFYWIDSYMPNPKDGFWHMGMLLLNRRQADLAEVAQHMLGWLVKAFFLPLMLIAMIDQVEHLGRLQPVQIFTSFKYLWDFAFVTLFALDLLIATTGYIFAIRLFDSHIRSTEPTLLGWLVTIMCYQPFWSFFADNYLNYEVGMQWGDWLVVDSLLYTLWGSLILLLLAIYLWASLAFGIRFSNLTHRGILTNGPYRWCKHPAYVSKNLSWWLISMPFMVVSTPSEALRHSVLLLIVNVIYFVRAKTEERHLAQDPVYVQYAQYINEHGLFAWLGKQFPWFKFKLYS